MNTPHHYRPFSLRLIMGIVIANLIMFAAFMASARADTPAVFTWTPNTESDLAGYELHYTLTPCPAGALTNATIVTLGVVTTHTIQIPVPGAICGQLKAYDTSGNRSLLSNKAEKIAAGTHVPPPGPVVSSDLFDRADATTLGVEWTGGYTASTNLQIVGMRVRAITPGTDATMTYALPVPEQTDQWAEMTLATWTGPDAAAPRLLLRYTNAPAKSGYEFAIGKGAVGFRARIGKWTNGVFTSLISENTTVWAAGDKLRAEAQGPVLRLYRNNFLVLTVTDAAYTSGRAGVTIYSTVSVAATEIDNFIVGSYDQTAPAAPVGVEIQP